MSGTGGVFDNRQTFLTIGDYLPGANQDWIAVNRRAEEMARTQQATVTNMVHLPHIGKTIAPYHLNPGDVAWLTPAQTGIISSPTSGATVASNYNECNSFSQQNITGVTYAGNVQMVGAPYNVHQPSASGNWSADSLPLGTVPYPNTAEDPTQMIRVLNGANVDPCDNLVFNALIPSSAYTPRGSIATFYFNGPAGDSTFALYPSNANGSFQPAKSNTGSGRYALKLRGDKRAYLYELAQDNATYIPRFSFQWDTGNTPASWTLVSITVAKRMWQDTNGNWKGDVITFTQTAGSVSPQQLSSITNTAELASITQRFQNGLVPAYQVPRLTNQPMTTMQVMMDVAVDCRASWNASRHVYQATGTITDDLISFNRPVTQKRPLTVVCSGTLNLGTTWDISMTDQLGNACSPTGYEGVNRNNNGAVFYKAFTPNANQTGSQVTITSSASGSTFRAPVISDYSIFGVPLYQQSNPVTPITIPARQAPPSLWQQVIESVDIHYQQTDPSAENATIVVNDLTGELDPYLEGVNMLPIHVWVEDPSLVSNPNQVPVTIFRGYILVAQGKRNRTYDGQEYPNQLWTQWTLNCVGEWARLQDATLPVRQMWQDTTTLQNSQVTDCVSNMLQSVYPPSMVNVPSSSVRLLGTDASTWTAEPGTRVSDLTQGWMQDYFGGYIQFDFASGALGQMRGIFQNLPPYNNLAIFEIDHPTILHNNGQIYLPQVSAAYGVSNNSGQTIQHTFIQAETFQPHIERAEGNCVIVFGGGGNPDAQQATGADATMFSNFAINVNSYNFLNLNPGDNGYPNGSNSAYFGRLIPIRVFRYDLPNQQAVDWYCRRVFDRSCYAKYYITFMAPLLFVNNAADPSQVRPRPLRYYDPVLLRQYDGSLSQFLVVSCEPTYTKDAIQMARYTIVTQENINQRAVVPPTKNSLLALKKAQARVIGFDMSNATGNWSATKQGGHINSAIMALPNPTGLPLQDLDNNSSTFGQFYSIVNYSSLPGSDLVR